ncbi:putative PurR-regulated permease PerM [Brevibacillus sp. AG162]|uniref:AI-2E family transporter n=1 Tax=Brevibacillus sp. AG162 TaxID=2572910 RepID=UPI00114F38D4|nr:AI-2E family transporter [Brevibacillus sp. AG162]TQK63866.1 putative PurR-regulated permease PerM [Brevibacillus sp. AG162]
MMDRLNWPDMKKYIMIATYTVLLFVLFWNFTAVKLFVFNMFDLLDPVIYGIAIAYILNILLRFYEERVFAPINRRNNRIWLRVRRPFSILLTLATVLVFLTFLMWFIVPQLISSISVLAFSLPNDMESWKAFVDGIAAKFHLSGDLWNTLVEKWNDSLTKFGQFFLTSIPVILEFTKMFTISFIDIIMGLMLSVYLLLSKEKLTMIAKKLIYAYASKERADRAVEIGEITNKAFSGFIAGQLTEALILCSLCFVGMWMFHMPYALLVSVIIGVTSIIPIFGAYIGTIPSAFIILMVDPVKAIWFVVFILVLQQIEGNFIYPKVVGNSIGLAGLWVMLALLVGGSLFGIMGMLLGIPAFAVVYTLVRSATNKRLQEKNIVIKE